MQSEAANTDFVDAHVHFWDHSEPHLTWAFLRADFSHPTLAELRRLDAPRFTATEFRAETDGTGVRKVIHIEAAEAADPVLETAWLQRMGEREGWPDAIVGRCRLAGDDVDDVLARHAEFNRFRGVRDLAAGARLTDSAIARGFAAVARAGGTVEVATTFEHFDTLLAIARRHPDLLIILGHAGSPEQRDDVYYHDWLAAMRRLGQQPNMVCKISALVSGERRLAVDRMRRWVLGCLESFGSRRCMFASDWPVDKLFTGYSELLSAYRLITRELAPSEQHAVFAGNAERVYRI